MAQKNKITRRWARRGTRPSAPHDQRTRSAHIFGAICPNEGKGAALVLPSLREGYGLAALRIGYAVGAPALVAGVLAALRTVPFGANRLAQAAAVAALADQEFLDRVRAANAAQRNWFAGELTRRGRAYLPSTTNFMAVAVADSALAQDRLAAEHGILVRDAGLFGFAGHVRVTLGARDDLLLLLDALEALGL